MSKLSTLVKATVAAAAAMTALSANAEYIVGRANLTFGQVLVTAGEIDWNPSINPGLDLVPTFGQFFTAQVANTGSFAGAAFAGVSQGLIHDLSSNPADANYMPIGFGSLLNAFKFNAKPGWIFNATYLAPGTVVPLFGLTPYSLTQSGGNVSATITLDGIACDDGGGNNNGVCDSGDQTTKFTSILSAQYTNTTIAAIVATLAAGGSLDNNTWSGTLEARIPEPATLGLIGLALAGAGVATRRAKKAAK